MKAAAILRTMTKTTTTRNEEQKRMEEREEEDGGKGIGGWRVEKKKIEKREAVVEYEGQRETA